MPKCTTLIRDVDVADGSGKPPEIADVAIDGDRIVAIGKLHGYCCQTTSLMAKEKYLPLDSSTCIPTTISA